MKAEASTILSSTWGELKVTAFSKMNEECLVVSHDEKCFRPTAPLVRVHSACLFGEAFHSLLCDCEQQLVAALGMISREGGYLVYLFQEGRSIGLASKIKAMELERTTRLSTVEAFEMLGFKPDPRTYELATEAMLLSGVPKEIRLITNNKEKLAAVQDAGFVVVERVEPAISLKREAAEVVRRTQEVLNQIPYTNVTIENLKVFVPDSKNDLVE